MNGYICGRLLYDSLYNKIEYRHIIGDNNGGDGGKSSGNDLINLTENERLVY